MLSADFGDIERGLVEQVRGGAPPSWVRARAVARLVASFPEIELCYEFADGSVAYPAWPRLDFRGLQEASRREGVGRWFEARLDVDAASDRHELRMDYDREPKVDWWVDPSWAADQRSERKGKSFQHGCSPGGKSGSVSRRHRWI